MIWLRAETDAAILSLHVQPGARKTEVVGEHGGALKIRLAAPPVDGKANAALIKFIAQRLGVSQAAVTLLSGDSSRAKRLRVSGVSPAQVSAALCP